MLTIFQTMDRKWKGAKRAIFMSQTCQKWKHQFYDIDAISRLSNDFIFSFETKVKVAKKSRFKGQITAKRFVWIRIWKWSIIDFIELNNAFRLLSTKGPTFDLIEQWPINVDLKKVMSRFGLNITNFFKLADFELWNGWWSVTNACNVKRLVFKYGKIVKIDLLAAGKHECEQRDGRWRDMWRKDAKALIEKKRGTENVDRMSIKRRTERI